MAKITAGVATSHVPAIGAALDLGKSQEPYWKPIFDGYEESKKWMAEEDPDVVILVYNDHGTAFALDVVPTFALGMTDVMKVDHGLTVPLSLMCGQPEEWPFKVIPLAVNVVQYPPPTGNRCFKLGRSIRKAVESFDEELKVVVMGTGGMSHQLHGERAGMINKEWDNRFLDDLSGDVQRLIDLDHVEYMRETGAEGIEMVMWLIMRGALNDNVKEVYRFYHVPGSNTAIGNIILENI